MPVSGSTFNSLIVMLDSPCGRMILANKQRWWYIPYSDDKQAPGGEIKWLAGKVNKNWG
ncbi:hypothetical protein OAQ37_00310 [Alphaproteobacteria bacterium]|nr:hypothetical protein [Alphaproteobacteria bacterium]